MKTINHNAMKKKTYLRQQKTKAMAKKKKREPIKEARRYVDNAREILDERGKLDEDGFFYETMMPAA